MHRSSLIGFYPYFKIIRPLNCLLSGIALLVGILISLGYDILLQEIQIFLLGSILMVLVSAGGYTLNDIFDLDIDKINQPSRILPSGRMPVLTAYMYVVVLFLLAFILSIYALFMETNLNLGIIPPVFTLFGILSLIAYAKWLKRYGFFGNFLITILATIPIIAGGFFIDDFNRVLFPGLVVFLLIYSRELIKDIEDIKGDVEASESFYSLPVLIGIKPTVFLTRILLVLLILSTSLPFIIIEFEYFVSYSIIIFATLIDLLILRILLTLNGNEENLIIKAREGRKLLKIGAIFGIIGFSLNFFTPLP